MDKNLLDTFGKLLMVHCRDQGIGYFELLAKGAIISSRVKFLQEDLSKLDEQQISLIKRCIIASIDAAVHDFLFTLQEYYENTGNIQINIDNVNIIALSDGMHGELFTEDGWMAKFSKYGEPTEIA